MSTTLVPHNVIELTWPDVLPPEQAQLVEDIMLGQGSELIRIQRAADDLWQKQSEAVDAWEAYAEQTRMGPQDCNSKFDELRARENELARAAVIVQHYGDETYGF